VVLEPMPQAQEPPAVAPQLAGHPRRGHAGGDPVEDQEDRGGAAVGPLEEGPGPGVEDPAAGGALVVQDRGTAAAVDPQPLALAAVGASQAVGVEQFDEFGVAGVLVHVIDQGEVHRGASVRHVVSPWTTPPLRSAVKTLSTYSAT